MPQDLRIEIVKNIIAKGELKEFREIFQYIEKKVVAQMTGINYFRFLKLVKNPKLIKFGDVYLIAGVLKLPPGTITDLIHGQIENRRKKK
jgi:hypothetical protein